MLAGVARGRGRTKGVLLNNVGRLFFIVLASSVLSVFFLEFLV